MADLAVKSDRRAIGAWAAYDFANSAFTTLITTFIYAAYFTQAVAPNATAGTSMWGDALTASAVAVALLSPLMGAMADRGGLRKRALFLTTAVAVVCAVGLYFPTRGQVLPALLLFALGNTAFELSYVFYNAFLPDLAPEGKIGVVSGYGWALGYAGGLLCLVVALFGFVQNPTPWFGFSTVGGQHVRATMLLTAAWFAVFSIPFFLLVREKPRPDRPSLPRLAVSALKEVRHTLGAVRQYRQIVRLLIAHLVYNDGLVTIFAFGGIYAAGTFGFSTEEIIIFGIALNVTAGLGAFAFGFLDDVIGGKRTIMISVVGLFLAGLLAVTTSSRGGFWAAALAVGILSGPNQAASRSLMGRFVPAEKKSEFFGFFSLSGKFTAFMGPFLLSRMVNLFGSQRIGMAIVLVFFLVGAWLLRRVDEAEGLAVGRT